MKKISQQDYQVEEAIKFLVFTFKRSKNNSKPVILHSIRVGLHLYNLGYDKNVVIGAILHDLIEDTDVSNKEIELKFGKDIARLVELSSFDESIKNKTERYKVNFNQCVKHNKEALIIRATDFFDNLDYYEDTSGELREWLIEKLEYFLKASKKEIKDEIIYDKLVQKYDRIIVN